MLTISYKLVEFGITYIKNVFFTEGDEKIRINLSWCGFDKINNKKITLLCCFLFVHNFVFDKCHSYMGVAVKFAISFTLTQNV